MQLTGHTSTHDLSFTPMHGSAITNGMVPSETLLAARCRIEAASLSGGPHPRQTPEPGGSSNQLADLGALTLAEGVVDHARPYGHPGDPSGSNPLPDFMTTA